MPPIDPRATMKPAQPGVALIDVRGPDTGHLYARIDPQTLVLVVRKGKTVERIDLRKLLGQT